MSRNFHSNGDVVQYTAGANITAGSVVKMGNTLGVALKDIANGATGPVAVKGVFRVPKVSAAVIGVGESLVWDVSANSGAGEFDDNLATPAAGDVSGAAARAHESAGATTTSLLVYFTGVPGTVTAGG